jgi:hypothetical protein
MIQKKKSRISELVMQDVPLSRSGSSAYSRDPHRKCEVCGATETPQWRRGPGGKRTLCNACGVKWSSGRLQFPNPPGSPFPFTLTESEHVDTSDPTSAFEDIEIGSPAWKLQLEVSRLKSKLRETNRNQKKLFKLLSEGTLADRQIDKCYRKLITVAKTANPKPYSSKTKSINNIFRKSELDTNTILDDRMQVRFGDVTERDLSMEKSLVSNFISVVKRSL